MRTNYFTPLGTLLFLCLCAADTAIAQEKASPEFARHFVSTRLIADVSGQYNLRYEYGLSEREALFVEGSRASAERNPYWQLGRELTDPEQSVSILAYRYTTIGAGYRLYLGKLDKKGAWWAESSASVRSAYRYQSAYTDIAATSPNYRATRALWSPGLTVAIGYQHSFWRNFTVGAQVGGLFSLDRSRTEAPGRQGGTSAAFSFTNVAPVSSLLTVGKRF